MNEGNKILFDTITENQLIKAGCILMDLEAKKIGLVYRTKQQDYSFPKGRLEENETIINCAKRETIEETQREIEVLCSLGHQSYVTKKGVTCTVYWYLAKDLGQTTQKIQEDLKHQLIWLDFDEVEQKLSYENLKGLWHLYQEKIKSFL